MGIFNTFIYSDGTNSAIPQTLYGNISKLEFSVAPFIATAINNEVVNGVELPKVSLSWTIPNGDIFGFRVVRNQEGFSETEEDGNIIYELFGSSITPTSTFIDFSIAAPIAPGRYIYYTIWVLLANGSWYLSDSTYTLIPKNHNVVTPDGAILQTSNYKLAALLPRAFTSLEGTPNDEINPNSDLYNFLGGIAYTWDELLTFADLLAPSLQGKNNNPNFVPVFAKQLGLDILPNTSLKTQKRLIREATFINKMKGTKLGLQTFVEAMTNYSSTVDVSSNLLLSIQDSSFYKTTGYWVPADAGRPIVAVTTQSVPSEPYAIDTQWCAHYHSADTTTSFWLLGISGSNPILKCATVTAGLDYTFTMYGKGTGSGTLQLTPKFYDVFGNDLGTGTVASGINSLTLSSSWAQLSHTTTAPDTAAFVGLEIVLNSPQSNKEYYFDMVQVALASDTRSSEYREPRAVEVYVAPSKVNWLKNPSFTPDTDAEWTVSSGVTPTYVTPTTVPGVLDGSHMLKMAMSSSTQWVLSTHSEVITPGEYYSFSIYAKTGSGIEQASISMSAYDQTADSIAQVNSIDVTASQAITLTTDWARYSITLFIPPALSSIDILVSLSGTSAGHNVYVDAAQVEIGYSARDYFDGDYEINGGAWSGSKDASVSYLYSNKITKLGSLETQLPKQLPMNTSFMVFIGLTAPTDIAIRGISS